MLRSSGKSATKIFNSEREQRLHLRASLRRDFDGASLQRLTAPYRGFPLSNVVDALVTTASAQCGSDGGDWPFMKTIDVAEAVARIPDGARLMIGGFMGVG